jgi:hypothetical protein
MQRQGFVQRLYLVYLRRLVGYAASIYIAQSGSADPGEWDHFVPTDLTELTDIPTRQVFKRLRTRLIVPNGTSDYIIII